GLFGRRPIQQLEKRRGYGCHGLQLYRPNCRRERQTRRSSSAIAGERRMAERVGFEPTCRLPDKTLSRRPRYDHFGTSPFAETKSRESSIISDAISPRHGCAKADNGASPSVFTPECAKAITFTSAFSLRRRRSRLTSDSRSCAWLSLNTHG